MSIPPVSSSNTNESNALLSKKRKETLPEEKDSSSLSKTRKVASFSLEQITSPSTPKMEPAPSPVGKLLSPLQLTSPVKRAPSSPKSLSRSIGSPPSTPRKHRFKIPRSHTFSYKNISYSVSQPFIKTSGNMCVVYRKRLDSSWYFIKFPIENCCRDKCSGLPEFWEKIKKQYQFLCSLKKEDTLSFLPVKTEFDDQYHAIIQKEVIPLSEENFPKETDLLSSWLDAIFFSPLKAMTEENQEYLESLDLHPSNFGFLEKVEVSHLCFFDYHFEKEKESRLCLWVRAMQGFLDKTLEKKEELIPLIKEKLQAVKKKENKVFLEGLIDRFSLSCQTKSS